jgi:hypothetical protein
MTEPEKKSEPVEPSETPPVDNPFAGFSIAGLEADLNSLMGERMTQLDEMLAGLERLVEKIEKDIEKHDPPQ